MTAAAGAARFGAKTILMEKKGRLGGDCLHTGCVPSKALIRAARVLSLAGRAQGFGLPPLKAEGSVDLGAVMDSVQEVIDAIQVHDSPERFRSLGAQVLFGSTRFVDDHTVMMDNRRITARAWIIATGSHPAIPPVAGLDKVPCWTSENLFSQRVLPARLIVLGGGPIGLEMAQAFCRLGSKVTVVEFMERILSVEDPAVTGILHRRLEAEGIEIRTGTRAVKVEHADGTFRLFTTPAQGNGPESTIEGDALLVATGRIPATEGLGLEEAGVAFSARGIPTDNRMRTNVRHIYACGDCTGRLPFTHAANYEAGVALTNAILHLPRTVDFGRIGWCTYTDPEVASIGLNEQRAAEQGVEYRVFEEEFKDNDRAQAERETAGRIRLLVDRRERLLGCQIIGPHAGELIHDWVVASSGKVRLSAMAGMVFVYPTLSEISKRVAGEVYAEKVFGARTRGLLKLLFGYRGRACPPRGDNC